jgi:hypothetical protein
VDKDLDLKKDLGLDVDWEGNPLDWRELLDEDEENRQLFNKARLSLFKKASASIVTMKYDEASGVLTVSGAPWARTIGLKFRGVGFENFGNDENVKVMTSALSEVKYLIDLAAYTIERNGALLRADITWDNSQESTEPVPADGIVAKFEIGRANKTALHNSYLKLANLFEAETAREELAQETIESYNRLTGGAA